MPVQGVFKVMDRCTKRLVQIAYELHGTGAQHVVFLSGLNNSREAWNIEAQFLAQRGYQVLTIDNRGVGHSDVPQGNYVMEIKRACYRVSMGGMIAMQLASDYPSYIKSLCLVSTTAKWQPTPVPGALPRKLEPMNPEQEAKMLQIEYPKVWLDAPNKYNPRQTNRDFITNLFRNALSSSKPQTPEGYERQLWAVEHHYLCNEGLQRILHARFPVLVCTGDQDAIIAASNSEFLAKYLKARLEVFRVCGHAIFVQEAERFCSLLLEHFSKSSNYISY
ncbi:Alpha/Beta hydrolase protein [Syncephalis fuscata]|nr:Alpha/Beta hydrolase protein [Syncephalis fuscata]